MHEVDQEFDDTRETIRCVEKDLTNRLDALKEDTAGDLKSFARNLEKEIGGLSGKVGKMEKDLANRAEVITGGRVKNLFQNFTNVLKCLRMISEGFGTVWKDS